MSKTNEILRQNSHRPYKLPEREWSFYQEWKQVLFIHWAVPQEIIRPLVPSGLELDEIDGKTYVSLVPFTVRNIRPRYIPPFSPISDFHEVNLRVYVIRNGIPGIYFLSIEAHKRLSAFISRTMSGLPYEYASMTRKNGLYRSKNDNRNFQLEIDYEVSEHLIEKSQLDKWLTERYALFESNEKLYRFDVHHKQWPLQKLKLNNLRLNYKIGDLNLASKPDYIHYSDGVEVITWNKIAV